MKKHHYYDNSYQEKHLIVAGLQFQILSSWQEAPWFAGRHGAGEEAENPTS